MNGTKFDPYNSEIKLNFIPYSAFFFFNLYPYSAAQNNQFSRRLLNKPNE